MERGDWEKKQVAKKEEILRQRFEAFEWKCQNPDCNATCTWETKSTFHWDHVNPATKLFDIATGVHDNCSIEKFVAELEKCQWICTECHKVVTRLERQGVLTDFRWPKLLRPWAMFIETDDRNDGLNVVSNQEVMQQTAPDGPVFRCLDEGAWFVTRDMEGNAYAAIRKKDNKYFRRTKFNTWLETERLSFEREIGIISNIVVMNLN